MVGPIMVTISGGSKVCNNACSRAGGGVEVADDAKLTITGGSSVCSNRGVHGAGLHVDNHAQLEINGGSSVCGNVAKHMAGAIDLVSNSTSKIINATICNNTGGRWSRVGGAGVVVNGHPSLYIESSQVFGHWLEGEASGGAFLLLEHGNMTFGPGVMLANNTVRFGHGGASIAAYDNTATVSIHPNSSVDGRLLTKCDRSIYLGRLPCLEGEYQGSATCQCCPEHQFGFEANATYCYPCPEHAFCPGGLVILPKQGYYHSSERSAQMHACPIASSCLGNAKCARGYTGNLCGACAKGYGQTLPLRCGKCMASAHQFGVYIVLVSFTVVLITVTVHFTLQDNKAGDNAVRPSDLCKVLAQFLQYLVILGSMSVPWPRFMTWVFSAATVVFGGGASGQAMSLSLDCWLAHFVPNNKVPLAVQRQLALVVVSVAILLAVILLMSAVHIFKKVVRVWRRRGTTCGAGTLLWCKLRVAVLVVAFYAYPTLVKVSVNFFACLRIDDKESKQPYPKYYVLNHTSGYWVQDIQQECFSGWHKAWALSFGVLFSTILCVAVPVSLWLFLFFKKKSVADPTFREHYGFLYRNFRDRWVWWEAIWAGQTVLLTAVSVFHFMLQAYYALFAMCLVLLLSAALQLIARPYAEKELHRLHLTSTLCLFLNAWLSIALFADAVDAKEETLHPLHTTIGVVLVVMDSLFIIWCVCKIVKAVVPTVLQGVVDCYTKAKACWGSCHGIVCSTNGSRLHGFKQHKLPVLRNAQQGISAAAAEA